MHALVSVHVRYFLSRYLPCVFELLVYEALSYECIRP
jgi:hypothetical protein